MKNIFHLLVALIALSMASNTLMAQDWDYHPALSDRFTAGVGAFRSSNSFKLEADLGSDIGDDIDFENALGVEDSSTLVNAQLRWKFGSSKRWSLSGQYFSNDATGEARLDEDYEWDGVTFKEDTFVGAGVKFSIVRAFIGRSFVLNDQHDFGMGIGIHNLDMSAYVEGEAIVDEETTGVQRADVSASQILPNIGTWYNFSPAKRWLIHARVDWISANIGDYDGTLWNTSVGVNFQAWRHVGFDLSWQYFNLNVGVDSSDWTGDADLTYSGPVLGISANW